jgi:hypothetical protein
MISTDDALGVVGLVMALKVINSKKKKKTGNVVQRLV